MFDFSSSLLSAFFQPEAQGCVKTTAKAINCGGQLVNILGSVRHSLVFNSCSPSFRLAASRHHAHTTAHTPRPRRTSAHAMHTHTSAGARACHLCGEKNGVSGVVWCSLGRSGHCGTGFAVGAPGRLCTCVRPAGRIGTGKGLGRLE